MSIQTRRRVNRKQTRKQTRKMAGGKRSAWLKKVMHVYKEMKARDPTTQLGDAMKAAKQK